MAAEEAAGGIHLPWYGRSMVVSQVEAAAAPSLGGGPDFVPKEGIFLLFISYTFLTRPGDISGSFFAHLIPVL